jgi:YesN/AraC family two-component response regulator
MRQRAVDAGCEDLLVKPLDPATLEELLAAP